MPDPTRVSPRANEDTIAAIATPPGEGGIGIVRLSGPEAVAITHSIFASSRGKDIRTCRARVFHGEIRDERGIVDEVLVHVMRAPHSYTCEDVVEINGHGGMAPLRAILEAALARGARLAEPGEFTKRAFLNGRIDLVQAEAVIDRVQAKTDAALRAAAAAAGGVLSRSLTEMRRTLIDALARVESAVDFPEEDVPELITEDLRAELERVYRRMVELVATADAGRLYREGARVALTGRPNVGKSSLFNALLRDARAIVTAVPGTTRDLLEEIITLEGVPVRVSDTAGLRLVDDEVERIGVERAREALRVADIVAFMVDASQASDADDERLAREVLELGKPAVLVLNKTDLAANAPAPAWCDKFHQTLRVSATTGAGLKELEHAIGAMLLGGVRLASDQGLLTRIHQRDSLRRAATALERLLENYRASPEFLSIDLRDALDAIGEITGDTTPEDVLERIFAQFCIGK